jgi:hypothetical protein
MVPMGLSPFLGQFIVLCKGPTHKMFLDYFSKEFGDFS